jgi:hypothetical protein
VDTKAGRGREDAATAMSRENEDLKTNLELRKEREKMQLLDDARNQLAGTGDSPVWDADQRDTRYQAYKRTVQGGLDTKAHEAQSTASHTGEAFRSASDIDARAAGYVEFPWSSKPGSPDASAPAQTTPDLPNSPQASSGQAGHVGNKETLDHLRELIAANKEINQTLERIFT